jgi:hypothetical protein
MFKRGLLILFMILIFSSLSLASSAFGVDGHPELEGYNSEPETSSNIDNWPQEAIDLCQEAQDNAIAFCEDAALTRDPGGWWIHRLIDANTYTENGLIDGKEVSVNIKDFVVGKWDCPPHNLLVDEYGDYIEQEIIYNEFIGDMSTDNLKVLCDIGCGAWSCPLEEDTNPYQECSDYVFTDLLGDGIEDNTGETVEEFMERKVNEEPFGAKALCEWKEGCVLESYELGLTVPISSSEDEFAIRICSTCSCERGAIEPNYEASLSFSSFDPEDLIASANTHLDEVPNFVQKIISNEEFNVYIGEESNPSFGLVVNSEGVLSLEEALSDPSYNLYISEQAISSLSSTEDYINVGKEFYQSGDIKLEPFGFMNVIKVWSINVYFYILG